MLHLFANYKWTGPADPAIRCAARLRERGVDVSFAEAQWTHSGAEHRMREELRRWRVPVTGDLDLRKHFHPLSHWRDARALGARLARGGLDLLHCHLLADHLIAALAKRRAGRAVRLVRSLYEPELPAEGWRGRLAFAETDGVVAPTRRCAEQAAARHGLEPDRVLHLEPTVEPRAEDGPDARAELGLGAGDPVVGITARIQPHRRFDLLWQAARRVADAEPRARFVLLGRGAEGDVRRLVREPVTRLGLERHAVLPGYLKEPAYGRALRAFDVFLFLVPGSDGTCRAVREAMAYGKPVVATRRGILPDLVGGSGKEPGGVVCEESAGALAAAVLALLADPARRAELGANARLRTRRDMDPERAARALAAFYGFVAAHPRRR